MAEVEGNRFARIATRPLSLPEGTVEGFVGGGASNFDHIQGSPGKGAGRVFFSIAAGVTDRLSLSVGTDHGLCIGATFCHGSGEYQDLTASARVLLASPGARFALDLQVGTLSFDPVTLYLAAGPHIELPLGGDLWLSSAVLVGFGQPTDGSSLGIGARLLAALWAELLPGFALAVESGAQGPMTLHERFWGIPLRLKVLWTASGRADLIASLGSDDVLAPSSSATLPEPFALHTFMLGLVVRGQ